MLSEKKIRMLIDEDMSWLEKFASEKKTNIYKDHLLEADRRIHRMSVMYEVLEEAPSDAAVNIVDFLKNKLTEAK